MTQQVRYTLSYKDQIKPKKKQHGNNHPSFAIFFSLQKKRMNEARPSEVFVWRWHWAGLPALHCDRINSSDFYLAGSRWRLLTQQQVGATGLSVYAEVVKQVASGTLWQIWMRARHPSKVEARHTAWTSTAHVFSPDSPNQGFTDLVPKGRLAEFADATQHIEIEFACKAAGEEFQVREVGQEEEEAREISVEPRGQRHADPSFDAYLATLDQADRAQIQALLRGQGDYAPPDAAAAAANQSNQPAALARADLASVCLFETYKAAACTACLDNTPNTVTRCCGMVRVCSPCMRKVLQQQKNHKVARDAACPNCNRPSFTDAQVVWHLRY